MDRPLPVAIAALVHQDKILLIKRDHADYVGLWGLPGGKIELNEHLSETATRETKEECGIDTEFVKFLGIVSEHLIENNKITNHFLLHLCELKPLSIDVRDGRWFDLNTLETEKDKIVPSDFMMIQKMIKSREGSHYNCVIKKEGDSHTLEKFELVK